MKECNPYLGLGRVAYNTRMILISMSCPVVPGRSVGTHNYPVFEYFCHVDLKTDKEFLLIIQIKVPKRY
jgi:hypothetical protein